MSWLRSVLRYLRGVPQRPHRQHRARRSGPVAFDPDLVRALEHDHQRIERQLLKLLDALRTAEPAVCAWLADAVLCALRSHLARAATLYDYLHANVEPREAVHASIEPLERDLISLVARFEHFCVRGAACGWRGVGRVGLALRFEKTVNLLRVQFCQEENDLYPRYRQALEPANDSFSLVEWPHDGIVELVPLRVRPVRAQ